MGNYNSPPRFLNRSDGVVATNNMIEVPWHWESLFKHINISELTIVPVTTKPSHLLVFKKIYKKVNEMYIVSNKQYFKKNIVPLCLMKIDDIEKMLDKSIDVSVMNNSFVIQKKILNMVGIRRNVVLIGMLSYFEIWSRSVYISYSAKVKADFNNFLKDNNIE